MNFSKKKQTNLLFKDENHYKITFKRRDFYSANVFGNLKAAFNSFRAIISKLLFQILNFEKGYFKGQSQEIPKPRVLKPLTW